MRAIVTRVAPDRISSCAKSDWSWVVVPVLANASLADVPSPPA